VSIVASGKKHRRASTAARKGRSEVLSETLSHGLAQYGIGDKIRSLRLTKGLGLVKLGEHTGLSPAMLSKIERGQLFPTLPTLLRIALVFSVGLEHFFLKEDERNPLAIIRRKDRIRLPNKPGDEPPTFYFESLDFPVTDRKMEAFFAEFPLESLPSAPHRHAGAELIYVLKGQLAITMGSHSAVLQEGDVAYFDSGKAHAYRREGRMTCSVIVVTMPTGKAAPQATA
jgi:transcriptional regulator with XRE-family HTH domain